MHYIARDGSARRLTWLMRLHRFFAALVGAACVMGMVGCSRQPATAPVKLADGTCVSYRYITGPDSDGCATSDVVPSRSIAPPPKTQPRRRRMPVAANLPVTASHEQSVAIAKRVEASLKEALNSCAFVWPDLDANERKREVANAGLRLCYRWLDEVAGIAEPEVLLADGTQP